MRLPTSFGLFWLMTLLACLGINVLVIYWVVRLIQAAVHYLNNH